MGRRRKFMVSVGVGIAALCGHKVVGGKRQRCLPEVDTVRGEAIKDSALESHILRESDSVRDDGLDAQSDYGSCSRSMSSTWNDCLSNEDSSSDEEPTEFADSPKHTYSEHQTATPAREGCERDDGHGARKDQEPREEESHIDEEPPAKQRQKQSNAVSGILSLLGGIKPGSDLSKVQVPPQFNLQKSQLQLYGESVYCCKRDLLQACTDGETAGARMLAVVRWHISTTRLAEFGKAPFNPVLGETHHVTSGNLNVFLEQVSHHPPISALHATNAKADVSMTWWHQPVPRFYGANMEAEIKGKRILHLHRHHETYEMTSPRLHFRFLPAPGTDWVGKSRIRCGESGLAADLELKTWGLFGGGDHRVEGSICHVTTREVLYQIRGRWDSEVRATDKKSGKEWVLFSSDMITENTQRLKLLNKKTALCTESLLVWSDVMEAIESGRWAAAKEAKTRIEEEEREKRKGREREGEGEGWEPKFFSRDGGEGWKWRGGEKGVERAPTTYPLPRLL